MAKDNFDLLLGSILGIAGLGILAFLGMNKTNVTAADSSLPPPSQNKESGCGCSHKKSST